MGETWKTDARVFVYFSWVGGRKESSPFLLIFAGFAYSRVVPSVSPLSPYVLHCFWIAYYASSSLAILARGDMEQRNSEEEGTKTEKWKTMSGRRSLFVDIYGVQPICLLPYPIPLYNPIGYIAACFMSIHGRDRWSARICISKVNL